jgi:serine/threonine protein kinase
MHTILVLCDVYHDAFSFTEIFLNQLSDFGLAVTSGTENKNVKLSGTLGYAAPEYLLDGMQDIIWLPKCILIDHWFE